MRVTLKAVEEKLAPLGTKTELTKGPGYFLFRGGEAEGWIDRTVRPYAPCRQVDRHRRQQQNQDHQRAVPF
jgi:hypothetical protein